MLRHGDGKDEAILEISCFVVDLHSDVANVYGIL
jgi:hypothetical protein